MAAGGSEPEHPIRKHPPTETRGRVFCDLRLRRAHWHWVPVRRLEPNQAQLDPTALSVLAMLLPADWTFEPCWLACW